MSFNALAPHYRWMELVLAGRKLQRCRTSFLEKVQHADQVLLLGEGNGRFLPGCRRQFPQAQITCLDLSAAMIDQARRRLGTQVSKSPEVRFVHADALTWRPPAHCTYDLIVTNFFLDCFRADQLERLVERIGRASAPRTNWLLADFQVAPAGLQRFRSRLILGLMYLFFRATTQLPAHRLFAPDPYLEKASFVLRERRQSEWGLLRSDWWQRSGVN